MLDQTSRAGLRFCPLSYITVMSRRFERTLVGCTLVSESKESRGTLDIRIITITTTRDKVEVDRCLERHWGNAVQMFTDGSVCNGSVGCGGCAAVLIPPHQEEERRISTYPVGRNVEGITCEIHGVVRGQQCPHTKGGPKRSPILGVHSLTQKCQI